MIIVATNDVNEIAKNGINQIISQGGKAAERVPPKILRGTIENVYQNPFRLLGNFGKKQLNEMKKKDITSKYYLLSILIVYIFYLK